MNELIDNMSIDIFLGLGLCVSFFVASIQTIKLRKLDNEMQQQEKGLFDLKQEVAVLLSCEKGMGARIKQQQYQVHQMLERQDKLEISDSANTSYKQAMVLMQKGVSADDLIDSCDLSRGELDLISRLNIASDTPTPRPQAA